MVVENEGKEEYIHLKSQDNEVEYMESTLPKKESHDSDGNINPGDSAELREPLGDEDHSVVYQNLDENVNVQHNRSSDATFINDSNFNMIANDDPIYNVEIENSSIENFNDTSSLQDLKKNLF